MNITREKILVHALRFGAAVVSATGAEEKAKLFAQGKFVWPLSTD